MPRSWLETAVEVPNESAEAMANRLLEIGSPGLVTEDCGARTRLIAYFDEPGQVEEARRYASVLCGGAAAVASSEIGSQDWAENWKEHFPPLEIGEKLHLCPPWAAVPPSGRIAVVIDPGMAFGTGHHATTRACLELIERCVVPGCEVLDVGTGSGVLSIAALLLGAGRAAGVDIDPLATEAATANALRNGVADRFSVCDSLDRVEGTFPLAFANIQLDALAALEPRLASLVEPGGTLIVSGLLRGELGAWKAIYEARWISGETAGDAQWVAVAARRRAAGGAEVERRGRVS